MLGEVGRESVAWRYGAKKASGLIAVEMAMIGEDDEDEGVCRTFVVDIPRKLAAKTQR